MKKQLWAGLFAVGLLCILFREQLSRFVSDDTALLTAGALLAAVSGGALLLENYRR